MVGCAALPVSSLEHAGGEGREEKHSDSQAISPVVCNPVANPLVPCPKPAGASGPMAVLACMLAVRHVGCAFARTAEAVPEAKGGGGLALALALLAGKLPAHAHGSTSGCDSHRGRL